jgi:hypothetical protein
MKIAVPFVDVDELDDRPRIRLFAVRLLGGFDCLHVTYSARSA